MSQESALSKILSLADFEREAEKRLPRPIFGYVAGACEDGQSLRANRDVFAEYELLTRILVDISKRSQQVEVFGKTYNAPFGLAPMGITAMSAYRGDVVLAEAAARAPTILHADRVERLSMRPRRRWPNTPNQVSIKKSLGLRRLR